MEVNSTGGHLGTPLNSLKTSCFHAFGNGLVGHCFVKVDNYGYLVGGSVIQSLEDQDVGLPCVLQLDLESKQWNDGPTLTDQRSQQMCGSIFLDEEKQDVLVVAGGFLVSSWVRDTENSTLLEDSTLLLIHGFWHVGPKHDQVHDAIAIGDGFCDDVTNNEGCNFDNGDCCQIEIIDFFCGDCKCHFQETIVYKPVKAVNELMPLHVEQSHCEKPVWFNDSICDTGNNVEECLFDGGDCCLEDKQCAGEESVSYCVCWQEVMESCKFPFEWIGDMVCDDSTNSEECLNDGGDCCLSNQDMNNCALCTCHLTGLPVS